MTGSKKRRQEIDSARSNNSRLVYSPDNMNLINNNGNQNSINVIDADPEADLNL